MQHDLLIINPSAAQKLYQDLSKNYAAIEPNIWAGMLYTTCKKHGYNVSYFDANVHRTTDEKVAELVLEVKPRAILFVVTGQNPNASTYCMEGATTASYMIREYGYNGKILFVGPHVNALPEETLQKHPEIDVVFTNEGVFALLNILKTDLKPENLTKIKGIAYRNNKQIILNEAEQIVPQEQLETYLPGIDWNDLYKNILTDYRTGLWHCQWNPALVSPFASIYTSLGCVQRCNFCMINIINRNSNKERPVASDYAKFRYWRPEFMIEQLGQLAKMGVKQLKIADELFTLYPQHYVKLCELIIERGYDFNIWTYARVDSIRPQHLDIMKKAGINMLGIGIESANKNVRDNISKGNFKNVNMRNILQLIEQAGISIGGNFMFGLTGDSTHTMDETYKLALELLPDNANFYAAVALPGSALYYEATSKMWDLPNNYAGYSFYAYNHIPMRTDYLTSAEVLAYRDNAFHQYYTNDNFLRKIGSKFGNIAVQAIQNMTQIKLKRQILGS